MLNGIGKSFIATWHRPSRKDPTLPGTKRLTKPNVWMLTDTSGSVSQEALLRFFSEMYGILRNTGKGVIIPWDAVAYPMIELRKARELARIVHEGKVKGGGGTVIAPALLEAVSKMARGDVVVVLTDGEIYDRDNKKTQKLLHEIAVKSSSAIFATMDMSIALPHRWHKVKIEL